MPAGKVNQLAAVGPERRNQMIRNFSFAKPRSGSGNKGQFPLPGNAHAQAVFGVFSVTGRA
jgi:hypothetical protein